MMAAEMVGSSTATSASFDDRTCTTRAPAFAKANNGDGNKGLILDDED